MKNRFDTIIYSANLSGVITSIIQKKKGQKVLLLNRYGFFGGSITESLNLLQKKVDLNPDQNQILSGILERICEFKEGFLFEDDDTLVLNPEVLKYVLQKICEENEIDLLFHITPYRIDFDEDLIKITVIGREGEIHFTTSRLVDFSTEFTFAPLIDKTSRRFLHSRVNFISLPVNSEVLKNVSRKIKLKDGRWWLSIDLNCPDIFQVEEEATQTLDQIDELLRQNKSRVQIVPAQSHLIFSFKRTDKFERRISFITDFVNHFEPVYEILISQKIEDQLKNEINI